MNISRRTNHKGEHEAIIELRWYAGAGSFFVEAVGTGATPDEAEKSARLFLGQARAKLNDVTTSTPEALADAMGANV